MADSRDALLEIGVEELPARVLEPLLAALERLATEQLQAARLPYGAVRALGTPRRLVLHMRALASQQEPLEAAVRGPSRQVAYDAQGEPTRQALGFARSQGVGVETLEVRSTPAGEYVFAVRREAGERTQRLLPAFFSGLIAQLPSSRPMRWGEGEFRFVRPIRWLAALYGDELVPFSAVALTAQAQTYGHRTISPGPHRVTDVDDYLQQLPGWGVILDGEERKTMIRAQALELAQAAGGQPLLEDQLVREVAGLVEYPTAFLGRFEPRYLELPDEVLVTTLRHHQRVFPVRGPSGRLLNAFIGVRNGNSEYLTTVISGNERVIGARLADATFFFHQDQKLSLADRLKELKRVTFLEGSGSLYDKVERMVELTRALALHAGVREGVVETATRAAWLCKADLVTHLVREFPELQGSMGRVYAERSGEPREVAQAIYEHYLPRTAEDALPQSMAAVMVGLADRLDTLAACFARGIEPTGSQDPYGLRRQALGVIQLLWQAELPLALGDLVRRSLQGVLTQGEPEAQCSQVERDLVEFLQQRARTLFADAGMAAEIIDAVFAMGVREVVDAWRRCRALADFARRPEFADLLAAYKRVVNLSEQALGEVEESQLVEPAERALFLRVSQIRGQVEQALNHRDYAGYLRLILSLKPSIDAFFDQVLVLTEEANLRANRLSLLAQTRQLFGGMAGFDRLSISLSRKVSGV